MRKSILDWEINFGRMHLHSRAPMMSTIYSSLKILSRIVGLLSKTARVQITGINKNDNDKMGFKINIMQKLILTDPFDNFENHVKAIHVFQVFTHSK